ncbi:MAG: DUF262 domain-containing protein [Eggerthellaceae bacterium]|nr:DUF262 domain-containing protein [Eggerthellaceae bacterium]
MKVKVQKLLDLLHSEGAQFVVPPFQRPYSWTTWQCEVLWQDIERISKTSKPHFFGAVFYRKELSGQGAPALALIDGQQRTLTSLLMLSALRDHLAKGGSQSAGITADQLSSAYLLAKGDEKAIPSKRDRESYAAALSSPVDEAQAAATNAQANKALFAQKMADPLFDPDAFWRALGRLEVVAIELEGADDAQSIFESFNSKGVPLVAADMVRNYLLFAQSPDEQVRLFREYWAPIQGLFGDDPGSLRLNNALRAWTVIRCKTPKAKSDAECFDDFKQYFLNEFDGSSEDLMEEIFSFCAVWAENYRYHAVKTFRSADWSKLGRKTLVSDRPLAPASEESRRFYAEHYGIQIREDD